MPVSLKHLMRLADAAMMGVPHESAEESQRLLCYLTDAQREDARIAFLTLIGERKLPVNASKAPWRSGREAGATVGNPQPAAVLAPINAGRPRPAVSPAMPSQPPRASRAPRPAPFNRSKLDRSAAARRRIEEMRDMQDCNA